MPCQRAWSLSEACGLADTAAFSLIFGQLVQSEFTGYVPRPLKRPLWQREQPEHVTDLWRRSRICRFLRHGFWMLKLRVGVSWICGGSGGFGRWVEPFVGFGLPLGCGVVLGRGVNGLFRWAGVTDEDGFVRRMERIWRLGAAGFGTPENNGPWRGSRCLLPGRTDFCYRGRKSGSNDSWC